MGTFLHALIYGIKDVFWNGSAIPTRSTVNFIGGSVADNPTDDRTDITLPDPTAASAAVDVSVAASAAWYDATSNGATDAQSRFNKIVNDLKSTTGEGGAGKLGSGAISGSPNSLAAGGLWNQMGALLGIINAIPAAAPSGIVAISSAVASSDFTTASASYVDVTDVTLNLSDAKNGDIVAVFWSAQLWNNQTFGGTTTASARVVGDAETFDLTEAHAVGDGISDPGVGFCCSRFDLVTLTADHTTVTVKLRAKDDGGNTSRVKAGSQIVAALIRL